MQGFLHKYGSLVTGVLSGLDRVFFRGTQRMLSTARGVMNYLWHHQILLKDFTDYAQALSDQVRRESQAAMESRGCAYEYLSKSGVNKEELARGIAQERGIKAGPICLLGALETCMSYQVVKDARRKQLVLEPRPRKCLHLYHYLMDEQWGQVMIRLQTWLPMQMSICMNGREWLCRSLAQEGIGYLRADNTLRHVADVDRAQALLQEQFKENWGRRLNGLCAQVNPAAGKLLRLHGEPLRYYWSVEESEYATDLMFKRADALAGIYGQLVQASMLGMSCQQVLRFLGKTRKYQGELLSDLRRGPEGVRVKFWAGRNHIKMYDKAGQVLRVETTINRCADFRVYRGTEERPEDKKNRRLRKGVADLHRRGEISHKANARFLEHLSTVQTDQTLAEVLLPLGQGVTRKGKAHRGLQVLAEDAPLLAAVGRGEHAVNGFRNADIRQALWGVDPADRAQRRRRAGRVTRLLGLLHAHGVIAKVSGTRRWILTAKGQRITMLLGAAKHARANELLKAA
jgi:hypothetical protein